MTLSEFLDGLEAPGTRMSEKVAIKLNINGRDHRIRVEPRKTLADAIREDCGKTGTPVGCSSRLRRRDDERTAGSD